MKHILLKKYINSNRGFTLIELLVVVIIIGILSALSLPNFISQIGKARETEAKNNLGAISRAQQAYHFEKQSFANSLNILNIDFNSNSKYYNFPAPSTTTDTVVRHQALANNSNADQTKNYAVGIYYNSGLFETSLCQAFDFNQTVDVASTANGSCTNSGVKLQ